MFNLFQPPADSHLKRAAAMLREANMARIEHQAAADHHGALARMYADRASWLEKELGAQGRTGMRLSAQDGALGNDLRQAGTSSILYHPFDGKRRIEG